MTGVFYSLGRKAAPAWLKGKWMLHALTGNNEDIVESEYLLGCLLAEIYERKTGVPADSVDDEALARTGGRLADKLKNKERKFSFKRDNAPEPNALALPGGFVYISAPLLDLCGREEHEIAFILAHEMGHVVRGHASKRFVTSVAANAISRTGMRGGPARRAMRDLLVKVMERGYSRAQEMDADSLAVRLMQAARFDPAAGEQALARIAEARKAREEGWGEYFSTHPPISSRIENIRQRIGKK